MHLKSIWFVSYGDGKWWLNFAQALLSWWVMTFFLIMAGVGLWVGLIVMSFVRTFDAYTNFS